MPPPDRAINTQRSLQLTKLEVKFLIVPWKRALIMTWQGQFICSTLQNGNDAHPLLPNQLCSSTRRVIGTWWDRHSSEVQPWSWANGVVEDSKSNNFCSSPFMPQRKQNKCVDMHGHMFVWESVHVSVCAIKLFVGGRVVFASLIFLLAEI